MSNMQAFLKSNKKPKENVSYAATESLLGEDGKPLLWELRHISTKEDNKIRDECTAEVQVPGKMHVYRHSFDSAAYLPKLLAASVVFPDLYNAELQDSYGVKTPEALIVEMVDDPGEYNALTQFVQKMNKLDRDINDQAKEAKN